MIAINKIKKFSRQIGEQFGAERVILEEGKELYEVDEEPSPSRLIRLRRINNNRDEDATQWN
jgi:hypothetical protein